MTPHDASVWNSAIDAALVQYKNGKGYIAAWRVRQAVTVEHIGTTTKQEVVDVENDKGSTN